MKEKAHAIMMIPREKICGDARRHHPKDLSGSGGAVEGQHRRSRGRLTRPLVMVGIRNKEPSTIILPSPDVKGVSRGNQYLFAVTVDYAGLTDDPDAWLKKQIAAGNYGYVKPSITCQNFPITGTGTGTLEEEIILIHLDRDISSDDAVRELNEMGLEPARIEHATAFGAKYPDVPCEYPVVFLGSVWTGSGGGRRVPYLSGWGARRWLDLGWWDDDWDRRYRFAAVRKSPVL